MRTDVAQALARLKQAVDLITEAESDLALVDNDQRDLLQAKWHIKQFVDRLRDIGPLTDGQGTKR